MMIIIASLLLHIVSACKLDGNWILNEESNYVIASTSTTTYNVFAGVSNAPFSAGNGVLESETTTTLTLDYWTTFSGIISNDCQTITWTSTTSTTMIWNKQTNVSKVHVVFMNHLDVGYNGINPHIGFINNVLNVYFHEHFPRALILIDEIRRRKLNERFIYTTHAWLVSMYLDCPANFILNNIKLECPNDVDIQRFINAIKDGYITWHAGPFNLQIENMDSSLFEYGLSICTDLDTLFNITRPTRVISQRDVPGMTKAVIPLLHKNGVSAITVGENFGAPRVATKAFVWEDTSTNTSVLAMWHPFGYGGISLKDCVVTENGHALAFAFRTDNSGPIASIQELLNVYSQLKAQFPYANVVASTYENFVFEGLLPSKHTLPIIRGEIGDVWIQGIASDPKKMAEFRIMSRIRRACLNNNICDVDDQRIKAFSRYLLKIPEHTWGLPGVYDNENWSNTLFEEARRTNVNYKNCENAWREQRYFNKLAMNALKDHPIVANITKELHELEYEKPDIGNMTSITAFADLLICTDDIGIQFDGFYGSIIRLYDKNNVWASSSSSMKGLFMYSTLNSSDFEYMEQYYGQNAGYSKPNTTCNERLCANPTDMRYYGKMSELYWYNDTSSDYCRSVVKLIMPTKAHVEYGSPEYIYIDIHIQKSSSLSLDIRLSWFNKTTTRLPEQIFYSFYDSRSWYMNKLDELIMPNDIILNGSQYQHGVWNGIELHDVNNMKLIIETIDAPLISPITNQKAIQPGWSATPTTMPVPLKPLESSQIIGLSSALYSNVWNTNYILWYPYNVEDMNAVYRFKVYTATL